MEVKNKSHFWSNGLSIRELEKVLLCFLFFITVMTILYMWTVKSTESALINDLAYAIGGFLVVRKGLSYFKSSQYYKDQSQNDNGNQDVTLNN